MIRKEIDFLIARIKEGAYQIKGLNWKQPYAALMLHGKIETRVWPTEYREWVLIIASQKAYDDHEILHIAGNKQYGRIHTICPKEHLGKAIAIAELVKCRPMKKEDEDACLVEYHEPWLHTSEKTGKKSWRRLWCHVYENVIPIIPFEIKGAQKWKTLTQDDLKQIQPIYEIENY